MMQGTRRGVSVHYLPAILLLVHALCGSVDGKREIPIGAIFHQVPDHSYESEIAFRYAVERVNMHEKHFELVPIVRYVSPEDSFRTERKVCELAAEGVTAVFGPSSLLTAGIVGSICKTLEIPHIITHWDPEPLGGIEAELRAMTINLYPEADVLSRALADLIVDYSWKSFTIIYDSDEGLMRLKDILQIHGPADAPITVRQIDDDPDYRPLLKDIQSSGESHIILEIRPDRILELLRQAKEVKMLEEYQSYIITSLDAHTIDFEELRYSRSNITALRLMDTKSFDIKNAVHDWEQGEARMKRPFRVSPEHVHTESALYNDAVKIYATAIRELDATEEITPARLSCGSKNLRQWPFGLRIVNYMKVKTEHGITGPIIFDDFGRRAHFHLDIIELSKDEGFKKIATWDPTHGVNYTRSQGEVYSQIVESLQNKTFIVASRIGAPFLMFKHQHPLRQTGPAAEGSVLVPVAPFARRLDLYGDRVPGRLGAALRAVAHGTGRLGESAPVQAGQRRGGKHLGHVQRALADDGLDHGAGLRHPAEGDLDPAGGGHVVVLRPHHAVLVHGQSGRLPDDGADGCDDRVGRGSGQAEQDQVRRGDGRQHDGVLPDVQLLHVPAHVGLDGVGPPVRLYQEQRRGPGPRHQGQAHVRLSDGVDLARVHYRAVLRSDADRRPARLEGLRDRDASQLTVPHCDQRSGTEDAGGRQAVPAEDALVEGDARRRPVHRGAQLLAGERARHRQRGRCVCRPGARLLLRVPHRHTRVPVERAQGRGRGEGDAVGCAQGRAEVCAQHRRHVEAGAQHAE
ncbi:glutamate receptor ionotropic, kainate 2 isoform X2 [Anopheles gambiae]|uniref:glutamate receptor ionotropic, kainate 2 isoform X2 n=1 Tax=Anopheles gambiae TaxID=7165 RepID=UPI002AC9BFC9|nr:glutamate receptor ionotropic, kainate 2 isoform X2 [Anopheles gambiae]